MAVKVGAVQRRALSRTTLLEEGLWQSCTPARCTRKNEGSLDEPFKAGCSKSVLRLNDKFEPQILGRAMSLASPILKRAMQVGRWQVAGKVFQSGFSTT
jgi:hypothetical protein